VPKKSRYQSWISLLIFPSLTIILALSIVAQNQAVFSNSDAVMYTYLKNACQGQAGYAYMSNCGNNISFTELEPGDILLGGYPDCAYGRFSHAGIYLGKGQVAEGYVDLGITIQTLDHYNNYSDICLLKVKAPQDVKLKAVDYVLEQEGKIFYPLAFKPGDRWWNCSKIMWKAYCEQGINLTPEADFWIAPDAFYQSPLVDIIAEEGWFK